MAFVQFFKSRKEPSVMFDFIEETFDQMPLFVPMLVVLALFFTIFTSWNHSLSLYFRNLLQEIVRIVGTVRNCALKFKARYQLFRHSDVMSLTSRQSKTQRVSQPIYTGVDFGAEPASTAPESLCGLASLFFEAPAAHGCARTTVLSSRMFSMSGSSAKC